MTAIQSRAIVQILLVPCKLSDIVAGFPLAHVTYRQAHPASTFGKIAHRYDIDIGIRKTVRPLPAGPMGADDERAGQ